LWQSKYMSKYPWTPFYLVHVFNFLCTPVHVVIITVILLINIAVNYIRR